MGIYGNIFVQFMNLVYWWQLPVYTVQSSLEQPKVPGHAYFGAVFLCIWAHVEAGIHWLEQLPELNNNLIMYTRADFSIELRPRTGTPMTPTGAGGQFGGVPGGGTTPSTPTAIGGLGGIQRAPRPPPLAMN